MLIEGGYVLTNAHVVWPFSEVRIVFADGSEFIDAPVFEWDLMGDLALVGPIDTTISPLLLVGREELVIGTDTFLIGYPGEGEEFPKPSITRGLISRLREWEAIGMTYFQTDATIAGGQSGGVLASNRGEVIGISGFRFTEAGFGLVASATDVIERVDNLLSHEVDGIGTRRMPSSKGKTRHTVNIRNFGDIHAFLINEPLDTNVQLEATADEGADFVIYDSLGNQVFDFTFTSPDSGSFDTQVEGPYFVIPFLTSGAETGELELSSPNRLAAYDDPDDDKGLVFGQPMLASTDHPSDFDFFNIELAEGDSIEINVDSLNIDAFTVIYFPGSSPDEQEFDDDSGGGIFGTNAKVEYTAPHSGSYHIAVTDSTFFRKGGYVLTVTSPDAESQSEAYAKSLNASGNAKGLQGETDEAIELLTRAIELDPNLDVAYQNRALAHRANSDYDLGMEDINKAIELSPDDTSFLLTRGSLLWRLDRNEESLETLQSIIAIDDEYAPAYDLQALVYVALGNNELALESVNMALALDRRSAAIIETRAYVYLKLEEYDKALTAYRSVREEISESPYYDLGIGLAHFGLGDTDDAADPLNDGIREGNLIGNPNPQLTDLMAMATEALDSL